MFAVLVSWTEVWEETGDWGVGGGGGRQTDTERDNSILSSKSFIYKDCGLVKAVTQLVLAKLLIGTKLKGRDRKRERHTHTY